MPSDVTRGQVDVQNRFGATFSVTFPDFPSFDVPPRNFRLHQEAGKHDVMEILFATFSQFYFKTLKTGVPVHVSWSTDKAKGNFYGYVHHVSHTTQSTLQRPVTIRAIGSSFPLKEGGNKIWVKKTAPDIVTELAKQVKLKPVVTPDTNIFPQQSLSGHTRWEKIGELANRIGYVHQVVGTELHFHPLDTMVTKMMSTMPVMSFHADSSGPQDAVLSQTLDKFIPKIGDHFDKELHSRKDKTVTGIDPFTGQTYSVTATPSKVGVKLRTTTKDALFSQTLPTAITGSKRMAETLAKAHATLSKFSMHADGAGQGDPRISPYRTIEVRGTGDTTDGFWVINSVTHFVSWDGRYLVDFTCMSDGTGENKAGVNRPSYAGTVPVIPINTSARPTKPTSVRLSGQVALINQSKSGFKLAPRRWEGK